jgi:SpoVK/Ycf46/Vps4 family AAA+-type ATPase
VRIFEIHTKGLDLAPDVDFNLLGEKTDGYAGSDIALICREASLQPIREMDASGAIRDKEVSARAVNLQDFLEALKNVRSVVSPEEQARYIEWDNTHGS